MYKTSITILLLFCFNSAFSIDYFKKGLEAFENEEYKDAVEYYSKQLKTNRNANIYFNRALAYYYLEKYSNSIEDCTIALNEDPNDFEAWYYRGMAYYKVGDFEKAISDSKKSLDLNPNYLQTYTTLGLCYSGLENHEEAIRIFDYALNIKESSLLYYNKALVYQKIGMFSEAEKDFSLALDIDEELKYYWSRGVLYYNHKYYIRAIDDYSSAIEIDSTEYSIYYNRGLSCYANYQDKAALKDFTKTLILKKDDIDSKWYIALCHYELEDYEEALKYYNEVEIQDPDYLQLQYIDKEELIQKTKLGDNLWYIIALIFLVIIALFLLTKVF